MAVVTVEAEVAGEAAAAVVTTGAEHNLVRTSNLISENKFEIAIS